MAQTSQNDSFCSPLLLFPIPDLLQYIYVCKLIFSSENFRREKEIAYLWPKRVKTTRLGSFCSPLLPFPIPDLLQYIYVCKLIFSSEKIPKGKRNRVPMAQTSHNDSFGLVLLATAAISHPGLVTIYLCM